MKPFIPILSAVAAILLGVGCSSSMKTKVVENQNKEWDGIFSEAHLAQALTNAVKRFDKPMSRSEAIKAKGISFPFPKTARSIQFYQYSFWIAFERALRFDAPVQDCIAHAHTVLEERGKSFRETLSYTVTTVTNVSVLSTDLRAKVPWFTPDTIKRGLHIRSSLPLSPTIWIDLDTGTFYHYESD